MLSNRVDGEDMVHLIVKLANKLTDNERRSAILEQLREFVTTAVEVELEPKRPQSGGSVMRTHIKQVSEDGLFIEAPQIDGANRQLVRNEELRMTVRIDGQILTGEVATIGRSKQQCGDELVYGYRLTVPEDFGPPKPGEQRDSGATPRPKHYVVEAELRCLKRDVPVRGVIAALSEKMVHVRSMNAPDWLHEGDRLNLVADMPRPVGTIEQTVTVNSVRRMDGSEATMIGMTFVVPMHGLSKLFEHGPVRWG